MRIVLLSSSFNGLTQRVRIELCRGGHDVIVELPLSEQHMIDVTERFRPELIICPFLRERVPEKVWRAYRTIIIHPGPRGDRGPSSLDWALLRGETRWGVTALQAVEEMDAGPIWAWREFPMPAETRKSNLYNGPVTEAAAELVLEVVAKAMDPLFAPEPLDYDRPGVWGELRPAMRCADRTFTWQQPTERIVRQVGAADGQPGGKAELCGLPVRVHDVRPGPNLAGEPGAVVMRDAGGVAVHTADGTVWVGHLKHDVPNGVKLPATTVLGERITQVPWASRQHEREFFYHRDGNVGVVTFDFYNGAMSTRQCRRLAEMLRYAAAQDTKVLLVRGGKTFSNGVHLNVIEAAKTPELEAWDNINAIDDVCREIITCTGQLTVVAIGGNAGAGGVMMPLGADRVLLRDGAVLNPHYRTMGLFGSEYWTYVLPKRVGPATATELTETCLPVGAAEAADIGLADQVIPGDRAEFAASALLYAKQLATAADYAGMLTAKQEAREKDEWHKPLAAYQAAELAEMNRDFFADRNGFAAKRRAFVTKTPPTATPEHLQAVNAAFAVNA